MAYSQLPTRTTSDANAAADANTLQANIEALKGGTGSVAPTTNIEALALLAGTLAGTVDGVAKQLKWKALAGTLDADDQTIAAHGISDISKILFTKVNVYNVGDSLWYAFDDAAEIFNGYDATNIIINVPDTNFRGQSYKITIFYYE